MKISCILIEKKYQDDQWNLKDEALFLRCSVQDYFIKFDESTVKREDIVSRIGTPVTVEIEIVDGFWDDCTQDKTGTYARLKELI